MSKRSNMSHFWIKTIAEPIPSTERTWSGWPRNDTSQFYHSDRIPYFNHYQRVDRLSCWSSTSIATKGRRWRNRVCFHGIPSNLIPGAAFIRYYTSIFWSSPVLRPFEYDSCHLRIGVQRVFGRLSRQSEFSRHTHSYPIHLCRTQCYPSHVLWLIFCSLLSHFWNTIQRRG